MKNDVSDPSADPLQTAGQNLRQRAETAFRENAAALPESLTALTSDVARTLLHELRVHQIELEMQNEELRRAQHELDASRARYFDLYDLAPVGFCTISNTGLILEANLTLATLLGVTRSALDKHPFSGFIYKEDQDVYYRMRQKSRASLAADQAAQPLSCEVRMMRSDGTHFRSQLVATVVVTDPSASAGDAAAGTSIMRLTLSDITQRMQGESDQDKLQKQLVQSQKMESIGRLAGGVAHDFNNLLMGTMGYADLCRDGLPANHPVRSYLDEITKISQRSADLTRQLLAFARKQVIAPKELNLNAALSNMLTLLHRLLGENIQIIWTPGVNLSPVKIDPAQIDQVLTNLCVNARDAISGVGTITIETATDSLDSAFCAEHVGAVPGEYVRLRVSDTGCGMTKDEIANIFEPFYTTKEVGRGTGLGLATVYGIVKQNNGYIDVSSERGKGTTFTIYLPRVIGDVDRTPIADTDQVPRSRGETILLVEDEPSLRKTCSLFLLNLGYTVLQAETPAAALDLAAGHPGTIHLLFTDVIMPGMNGRQLVDQLRAVRTEIRILFMSGYSADVIAPFGVLDAKVRFLSKPFMRDDLARKVREVLDA